MAAIAPIKVDAETDRLISTGAHFLGTSKKAFVDEAVRSYIQNHRDEITKAVLETLKQLDGSDTSVVSALTGVSVEDVKRLGGMPGER